MWKTGENADSVVNAARATFGQGTATGKNRDRAYGPVPMLKTRCRALGLAPTQNYHIVAGNILQQFGTGALEVAEELEVPLQLNQ